jgi:hypothetical protein
MKNRWALALLVVVAACGGDDDEPTSVGKLDEEADQGDTCELLAEDDLAAVFDEVPEPSGTSLGAGFAECSWGADGIEVLVSVLPAEDFRSDYVEQLNVTSPVTNLGDEAVSFPGFVGVGRGSAGGGSVGFVVGDEAAMVAVRSGGDPATDAATAVELGRTVEAGL